MTEKEKRAQAYYEERMMHGSGIRVEHVAVCGNCRHFLRHYVITEEDKIHIIPTSRGHCIFPRMKDRGETDFCDHYEENGFSEPKDGYNFESLRACADFFGCSIDFILG